MTVQDDTHALFHQILDERRIEPAFQPVVDLVTLAPVGYEALARVPSEAACGPGELFAAGRASGRLVELDWLCREQAVASARSAGLRYPLSLFINAEPETLLGAEGDADRWASFGDLRCYAELTERALAARPAALLRAVDQVREQDWGIAMDDVGADPQSLALLPVVRPDVIKLDLRLLQQPPASATDLGVARVLHRALAQAAQTGAVVVAEGIETEQHLDLARAYGAHYGQGFLLGRPAPLPAPLRRPAVAVPLLSRVLDRRVPPSPFAVLTGGTGSREASRAALLEVARQLLAQAACLDPEPVVLLCVSSPDLVPDWLVDLLSGRAGDPVVAAVGDPAALARLHALRTATVPVGDPVQGDFAVVVVGGGFAGAVAGRPAVARDDAVDGTFDMVLSLDEEHVCRAANALLRRLP